MVMKAAISVAGCWTVMMMTAEPKEMVGDGWKAGLDPRQLHNWGALQMAGTGGASALVIKTI